MDRQRLIRAYQRVRDDLLAEREAAGHWIGELSTSALSTATAVSALSLFEKRRESTDSSHSDFPSSRLQGLIDGGIDYLVSHTNQDGGWGDTDRSYSNVATTMLGVAALHLAGVADKYTEIVQKANAYIDQLGRVEALRRRYGKDKTFAVPILTNCALAGLASWKDVSPLPFEMACLPQRLYRFLRMPVVSYAIPALVGIGQARYFHRKPWNPISRFVRWLSIRPSLRVLRRMQPASGGYLEAVPLTSFVAMSLAATGRCHHEVTREGIKFIVNSVRSDGSWPIDTNLATWNTTLAVNALAAGGEDVSQLHCLEWILSCQHLDRHPFTGADPGGWGWSDLSGAVPDADDTPGALLALKAFYDRSGEDLQAQIVGRVRPGIEWLLNLQNRDGGWPTFCRGWGKLPFDRSGSDLTAHAIRSLQAWSSIVRMDEVDARIGRGFAYLEKTQQADGSWLPLWFGNQDQPGEENPVYGTAKVLLAYRDTNRLETLAARRGYEFISASQNSDGGWGGGPDGSSIEETALAVEALVSVSQTDKQVGRGSTVIALDRINSSDASGLELAQPCLNGLQWLCQQVEDGQHGGKRADWFLLRQAVVL